MKCSEYKIENLYLIEQYEYTNFLISEALVEESKWHIKSDEAIRRIREYLQKEWCDLHNDYINDFIDMKLGKISPDEYRNIVLGGRR